MNSVISKGQPTIILRKIDPIDVYKRYQNGEFDNIEIDEKILKKSIDTATFTTTSYQMGSNNNNTSAMRDKSNIVCKIGFTNNFNIEGDCDYCRRELRVCSRNEHPVGIPVNRSTIHENVIYDVVGVYGTWECAYADLMSQIYINGTKGNPIFMNSEVYMKFVFHLMYPTKTLKKAKDYKFLTRNRGWMDNDEYDTDSSTFVAIPFNVFENKKNINLGY